MPLLTKCGTFQKSTSAAPATQQITGLGFQPKVLILITAGKTALDAYSAHVASALGIIAGPANHAAVAIAGQDNTTPTNTASRHAATALSIINYASTLLAEASLTSFDADGFTLNWTTNDANAYHIGYLALGGTAITAATTGLLAAPAAQATATISGLGFQPDAIIAIGTGALGAPPATANSAALQIGAADCRAPGGLSLGLFATDNVTTPHAATALKATLLQEPAPDLSTHYYWLNYALAAQDGFTLDWRSTFVNSRVAYLAIAGAIHVDTLCTSKPTAAPPQTLTLKLSRPPLALIALANRAPLASQPDASGHQSIGLSDGANYASLIHAFAYTGGRSYANAALRTAGILPMTSNYAGTESDLATLGSLLTNTPTITWNPCENFAQAIGLIAISELQPLVGATHTLTFPLFDSATGKTATPGLAPTAQRSNDGAALVDVDGTLAELSDGLYTFTPAATDLAGDSVLFVISATGARTLYLSLTQ